MDPCWGRRSGVSGLALDPGRRPSRCPSGARHQGSRWHMSSDRKAREAFLRIATRWGRHFTERGIDRFTGDAFAGELAYQCAIALRTKTRSLLDPILREIEIVDIPLRAELFDRAVDGLVLVALSAEVTADLGNAARTIPKVLNGSLVRAAERLRPRARLPHRSGFRRRRSGSLHAPWRRSRWPRRDARAGTASRSRGPARCASCRS